MVRRFVYKPPSDMGLAEHLANEAPDQDVEEFRNRPGDGQVNTHYQLDMKPDTEVAEVDFDMVRNLHIVEWVDVTGTSRMTSLEVEVLNTLFQEI